MWLKNVSMRRFRREPNGNPTVLCFRAIPAFFCCVLRYLFTLFWCHGIGAGAAPFAAQFDCGLIFGGIGGVIRGAVFDLTGENIADQLAELDGIPGTGKALCCHRDSMPLVRARRYTASDFKLYHYRPDAAVSCVSRRRALQIDLKASVVIEETCVIRTRHCLRQRYPLASPVTFTR